jgi:excisionase family DNA binding protein
MTENASVSTHPFGATASPAAINFLLVREAARIMRMDESTLYRHLRAGRFPAVKVGGRYLVPAAAVTQMADEALATGQCVIVADWAAHWRELKVAALLSERAG